jgi:DNA-binding YbaB/EbfC family protein
MMKMGNMGNMMKQAQQMQQKMQDMQQRLADATVTGNAGGSMVSITMTGSGHVKAVALDESLLKADEKEILEDLIVAALNDAKQKSETLAQTETQKIMGGLALPPGLSSLLG